MKAQQSAGLGFALYDLKQAIGEAGLKIDFLKLYRGEWRQLRRLEDHGIAARQSGRRFPTRNLYGIIPRANARNDPQGFASCVAKCTAAQIMMFTGNGARKPRIIFDAIRTR